MTSLLARSLAKKMATARSNLVAAPGSRRASVLVVADPLGDDGALPVATQSAVTAALQWLQAKGGDNANNDDKDDECILLTTGPSQATAVPAAVTSVLHATTTGKAAVAETAATAVRQAAEKCSPDVIMGTATKWGSSVVPRAAALLQVSPLSDVVGVVDESKYIPSLFFQETTTTRHVPEPISKERTHIFC